MEENERKDRVRQEFIARELHCELGLGESEAHSRLPPDNGSSPYPANPNEPSGTLRKGTIGVFNTIEQLFILSALQL